ncbi:MAG: winged helix-turn-helix domain-containing protein [Pyrinomonadaceae bacterium]|nr:winged helix-turn-helix domain-containing protein [Pyrinomonadaceae bacterium]
MSFKTNNFEFDDFSLDTIEKVLLRKGKPVQITPKAFELLQILVENHHHLVEKSVLMNTVWKESFVEEGNVTFTVWQLRNVLEDDRHHPRFIETVPKRGYRFIGNVREIRSENKPLSEISFEPIPYKPANFLNQDFLNTEQNLNFSAFPENDPDTQTGQTTISISGHKTLFGRTSEIEAIDDLLKREDVRLISLTGIGGSGKTSLARVVAERCREYFPDNIYFVELVPIFDADFVVPAIAQTLDVKESGNKSLQETLQSFLSKRKTLLILDNFEQVISAAPILSKIISATSYLKILVTSRASLRLSIENEKIVSPLEVPFFGIDKKHFAELAQFSSVQMFVERAQTVKPNFVLNERNAQDIGEICARLDGLPLALELAAARIRLLKPSAILKRLENRLQLLTSGSKDLPARQQTLRDTIEWSYELLTEQEKNIFRQVSVFAGGFYAETVEAVCENPQNGTEILDGLESLLTNNLLVQTEDMDGETRLSMLETIREFASEKLAENAVAEKTIRQRHAEYFLNYAKKIEREVVGVKQVFLLNQMEAERDNFRAAMTWFQDTSNENELKLAASLAPLWSFRGYLSEGIERLSAVLARNPNASTAVRAKASAWLGQLIWVKGDYVKAIEVCENALRLANEIDYPIIAALANFILGMSHWYKYNDSETAISHLETGLALYRKLEFDSGIVFMLVVLAAIAQSKGELLKAEEFLKESFAAAERTENNLALSIAKVNYGRLEIAKGNLERAKELCRDSLKLRGEISDRWGLVQCLEPLTNIALKEGNARHAAKMLGAIDVLLESLGASPPLILRADHEPNIAAARKFLDEKTFDEFFNSGRKLATAEIVELAFDDSFSNENSSAQLSNDTKIAQENTTKTDIHTNTKGESEILDKKPPESNFTFIIIASVFVVILLISIFLYYLLRT